MKQIKVFIFSLEKVIMLEYNADLSCQRLLSEEEAGGGLGGQRGVEKVSESYH